MTNKNFDVVGLGSALLDLLIEVDDSVLDDFNLKKGDMHLIDEEKIISILGKIDNSNIKKCAGGSCANTVAGVAYLGGKGVFCGVIGDEEYGVTYENSLKSNNLKTNLSKHEDNTGFAITFITPDSQRTFATYLGAAIGFRKDHVNLDDIINSKVLHIEGYQLEDPQIRDAVLMAMQVAKENGTKVSIDLADPNLISRIYDDLKVIVEDYADIVFVNEDEAKEFTQKEEIDALHEISKHCEIAIVKVGSRGSFIKTCGEVFYIDAQKVDVVDTTGAGDMYAAGFLYGITNGKGIEEAGNLGSKYAGKVVSQIGARLDFDEKKEKLVENEILEKIIVNNN